MTKPVQIGSNELFWIVLHGHLDRHEKLWVAHAPGVPGTFSPPPQFSDPDMHQGTCVMHVPLCLPGSATGGFLCSWWRGKLSRHSQRMRNQQYCVYGKRPISTVTWTHHFHVTFLLTFPSFILLVSKGWWAWKIRMKMWFLEIFFYLECTAQHFRVYTKYSRRWRRTI